LSGYPALRPFSPLIPISALVVSSAALSASFFNHPAKSQGKRNSALALNPLPDYPDARQSPNDAAIRRRIPAFYRPATAYKRSKR